MEKKPKTKKQIKDEKAIKEKLNKYARKKEEEESEKETGEPIQAKKPKITHKASRLRYKKLLEELENMKREGLKPSITQAGIRAGFKENYVRAGGLRNSKSWNELIEQYLPDGLLAETHHNLITAKKLDYMLFSPDVKDEDIYVLLENIGAVVKKLIRGQAGTHAYYYVSDNRTQKDATELAYKIKGKMSPEVIKLEGGLASKSDEELALIIKQQTKKFTKKD